MKPVPDQPATPPADETSDPWGQLAAELDAWQAAGRTATWWWRDDDATTPGPKLDRLIEIADTSRVPLALATIPARARPDFGRCLSGATGVSVIQHGYAHVNHAPRGQGLGAWELGLHRGVDAVLGELKSGFDMLQALAGRRFVPVLTPPWNRIDADLFPHLPDIGFTGVTAFGARTVAEPVGRLKLNHCHCDPVRWKGEPHFAGEAKALGQVIGHLAARRQDEADAAESTGLLTHHIDMDDDAWSFTTRLVETLSAHVAARAVSASALFAT